MTKTFKVLSILLAYPSEEWLSAIPEFEEILRTEGILPTDSIEEVTAFLQELQSIDPIESQSRYVRLFDQTRALSLHLFEHVHGDSRDRGQAMVDLLKMYEERGLFIDAKELPDHLPLFLEFLSEMPLPQARDTLAQPLHIVAALEERLRKRDSGYAAVMAAIVAAANVAVNPDDVAPLLALPEDDPEDLAALDEIWEEEAVTFGGGTGDSSCGPDRLQRQVRAANRVAPVAGTEKTGVSHA
ncbi:MAG: nitrate reductase molybdenum cofactor assembly chaperone [Alphaproteobacteria bacterium]|nr:nitrate reductase molybdenum cofactor assembly chaperone [Alphaproteobacteria bacterium]